MVRYSQISIKSVKILKVVFVLRLTRLLIVSDTKFEFSFDDKVDQDLISEGDFQGCELVIYGHAVVNLLDVLINEFILSFFHLFLVEGILLYRRGRTVLEV